MAVRAQMEGLPPGIPKRRPSPTTVRHGPRTHKIIELLRNYAQSQRVIADNYDISSAAVWEIGQRADLHELYEVELTEKGNTTGARVWRQTCGYCLATRLKHERGKLATSYGGGSQMWERTGGFEYGEWEPAGRER